jgi:hypothetical protein
MAFDKMLPESYVRSVEMQGEAVKARKLREAEKAAAKRAELLALRDRMLARGKLSASEARKAGIITRPSKARSLKNASPGTSPAMPGEAYRNEFSRAVNEKRATHSAASKPVKAKGARRYRSGRTRIVEAK